MQRGAAEHAARSCPWSATSRRVRPATPLSAAGTFTARSRAGFLTGCSTRPSSSAALIHGYPTVPFYPGSHGCVRVPVWLAPRIYGYDPPGSTIYIY
jgi:hypothetical protein